MESLASLGIGGPWTIGLGAVNAAMALGMVVTMMAVVVAMVPLLRWFRCFVVAAALERELVIPP